MQSLVVLANKLENGNSCDSLPEGYSWYPLEWDNEGYSDEELATKKNELMSEKFFTKGIISIYGPNYKEGTVVNDVVNGIDDVKIDNIGKKIIETRIYTLDGCEVIYPEMGINIVRYKYEDGSIESKKIIRIHE